MHPKNFIFSPNNQGGLWWLNDTNFTSKPLFKFSLCKYKIHFYFGFLITTGVSVKPFTNHRFYFWFLCFVSNTHPWSLHWFDIGSDSQMESLLYKNLFWIQLNIKVKEEGRIHWLTKRQPAPTISLLLSPSSSFVK